MKLSILSFNDHLINDGVNYEAFFPADSGVMRQSSSEAIEQERPNNVPFYAGQRILTGNTLIITVKMLGTISEQIDELKQWFNTHDGTRYPLVAQDENDSKFYYVFGKPVITEDPEGQQVNIILSVPNPIWQTIFDDEETWVISSDGATQALTVGGINNAKPTMIFTPQTVSTDGFQYRRHITIYSNLDAAMPNYPIEVTGVIDTAALISAGKMNSDGSDLRVFIDGKETNRWIDGINTTQTSVWVTASYEAKIEMTLKTALGTAAETEIVLQSSRANLSAIKKLPESGKVRIDNEDFRYGTKDNDNLTLSISERAIDQSSTAAHTAGAIIRWLEHDVYMCYGNPSISAPETDDTYKPIFDLDSNNNSWVYTSEFSDDSGVRPGSWSPSLVKTSNNYDEVNQTDYYTANQGTNADPAVKMGSAIKAWQYGQTWKAENGDIRWQFYNPLGIYEVSASGYKYRETANWASRANLGKSNGGSYFYGWAVESTPTTAATWQAWSQPNVNLSGSYEYLQFRFAGSLAAKENNAILYQVDDLTLKFTTANVPTVSLASETTNAQILNGRLTNLTTGDWLEININLALGDYVWIDTLTKDIFTAGGSAYSAVTKSNKKNWFDLVPGTNTLQFDLENPGSLELYIFWPERKA